MAAPRSRWGEKGGERKVEAQREGGVEGREGRGREGQGMRGQVEGTRGRG